jgi:hypothetical protein
MHLVVWPFAALPLETALAVWTAVNAAAAFTAGVLVIRELHLKVAPHHILPALVGILAAAATGTILATGQLTGLLLVPLVLAWRSARHGHWTSAGAWLGVLISVKPFLALFVPYLLLERQWKGTIALIATVVGTFVIGLCVFGWQAHVDWFGALRQVSWAWTRMNGSLQGLLARTLAPSPEFTPFADAPCSRGFVVPRRSRGSLSFVVAKRSVDHAFASLILGALLISPLGWVYYLWLVLPPALALWHLRAPVTVWLGLAALATPYISIAAGQPSPWMTLTIGALYTWATLLLWIGVARTPVRTGVSA